MIGGYGIVPPFIGKNNHNSWQNPLFGSMYEALKPNARPPSHYTVQGPILSLSMARFSLFTFLALAFSGIVSAVP